MFIHFTFSELAKQGQIEEQANCVIEKILKEKRLKASECPEFVPLFPDTRGVRITYGEPRVSGDTVVLPITNEVPERNITYLPCDVKMLCFIKTSFSQLSTSPHSQQYGKFGIALTDNFLRGKGIKPVEYYSEKSVWTNPLIKKWNYYARNHLYPEKHKELQDEIVNYRKPATLFPSFRKLTTIQINRTADELTARRYTYNRYPEGYDFRKEKEWRIIFNKGKDYLYFDEGDLFMVITPDSKVKRKIETFLSQNWNKQPRIEEFPISS